VFSLDNGRIPNLVYFNKNKSNLDEAWSAQEEAAKPKQVTEPELRQNIKSEMKKYFDRQGDKQLKVAIFCLAHFILCLPFIFNYFEP